MKDFVKEFPSYTTCISRLAKPLYANDKTTKKLNTMKNICVENTRGRNEVKQENDLSLKYVGYDSDKHCRKYNQNKSETSCLSNIKTCETLTPIEQFNVCDTSENYERKVQFLTSSDDYMRSKKVSTKQGIKNDTSFFIEFTNTKCDKDIHQKNKSQESVAKIPTPSCHHWLRVFPLIDQEPRGFGETLLLWTLSQVGFAFLLIAWSAIWVTVIYLTEGPSEYQNAYELKTKQNDLVIELATELRQIDPLSLSWVSSIARHVATARGLGTFESYFDLPGCVLFAANVLTTLGFGAPVPQSTFGQMATFMFALVGLPAHVYLVINAGTALTQMLKTCDFTRRKLHEVKGTLAAIEEEDNHPRGKCEIKTIDKSFALLFKTAWNKIVKLLLLHSTQCFPVIVILYYVFGAAMFGVLRNRSAVDTVMFPLEFTTTGGLHNVSGEVRILYAIYLESMALLVGCTVAVWKCAVADVFGDFVAKRHVFVYAQ